MLTDKNKTFKCSAGYNAVNPATGQKYLITAGHCFDMGEDVYTMSGQKIGTVETNFFQGSNLINGIEFIKLIDNSSNPYIFDGKSSYKTPVVSYMSEEDVLNMNQDNNDYVYFSYSQFNNKIHPLRFEHTYPAEPPGSTDSLVIMFTNPKMDIIKGESGSPILSYANGGIKLVGILTNASELNGEEVVLAHPVYYSAPIYQPQVI